MVDSKFKTYQEAIDHIIERANKERTLLQLLLDSLVKARKKGSEELDECLYDILPWPLNLVEYIGYLNEFSTWIPQQSDNPAWRDPKTGNSQEVYDRLCHFYYLVDQGVGPNGTTIVQNVEGFKEWLVDFAKLWGSFLDTTESFNNRILETFKKYAPKYTIGDSLMKDGSPNSPSGWLTFNQFFARELNPGLRPISNPFINSVITSPADCTYRMHYQISKDSQIDKIRIKKTHNAASIVELLKGSKHAHAFAGGTFVHYFLGPYSYHRFHTPVSGILDECYAVQGLTYLEVNIDAKTKQFNAPDNAENGYQFEQARGIVTIDTRDSPYGNMGIVAVIPVGMCQVSSVNMTGTQGKETLKGDEFGYFLFGGSDIILLFQEGYAPVIDTCSNYRLYGTDISICPPEEST